MIYQSINVFPIPELWAEWAQHPERRIAVSWRIRDTLDREIMRGFYLETIGM